MKNDQYAFEVRGPRGAVRCKGDLETVTIVAVDKLGRRCRRKGCIRLTLGALWHVQHETFRRAGEMEKGRTGQTGLAGLDGQEG